MTATHPQLRAALAVLLLATCFVLAGCGFLPPGGSDPYKKINDFVAALDLDSVGTVVAEGNSVEGPGNSLIHKIVVFDSADAVANTETMLREAGFDRPGVAGSETQVWKFSTSGGDVAARLFPLAAGESIDLGGQDGEVYSAETPSLAVDFYTSP